MANNAFKAVNTVITSVNEIIYTAPPNITTIVINAQLVNVGDYDMDCTFIILTVLLVKRFPLLEILELEEIKVIVLHLDV